MSRTENLSPFTQASRGLQESLPSWPPHKLEMNLKVVRDAWKRLFDNQNFKQLSEGERLKIFAFYVRLFSCLRRTRKLLETNKVTFESRQIIFDAVHKALSSSLHIFSPNHLDRAQSFKELENLESQLNEIPDSYSQSTSHHDLNGLDRVADDLKQLFSKSERVLRQWDHANGLLLLGNSQEFALKSQQGKKIHVITSFSSGALVVPALQTALTQKNNDVSFEVAVPFVGPKDSLKQTIECDDATLIYVLDDVIASGDTIRSITEAVRFKYPRNQLIIGYK